MPYSFRPSALYRTLPCPAWHVRSRDIPDGGSSMPAIIGTALHTVGELCLKKPGRNPSEYVGENLRLFNDDPNTPDKLLTAAQAELVAVYVEYVRRRHKETGATVLAVELRVHLSDVLRGTADAVLAWSEGGAVHVEVVDLKTGHVDVVAENNPQLMAYGLGAARKFAADFVHMTIAQPPTKGEPERAGPVSREELEAWFATVVEPRMVEAESEDPSAKAGSHCRYCPAAPTCPTLAADLAEEARLDFAPVPEGSAIVPIPVPSDLERLLRIRDAKPRALAFLRSVEDELMRRAMAGEDIPGYKLVHGRTNRRWKDEASAFRALARLGVKAKERKVDKLKSPAQVESLLKAGAVPPAKRKDFLARHTERPDGALKLVTEDDPAPAFDPAPVAAFEPVDDTEKLPEAADGVDLTFLE